MSEPLTCEVVRKDDVGSCVPQGRRNRPTVGLQQSLCPSGVGRGVSRGSGRVSGGQSEVGNEYEGKISKNGSGRRGGMRERGV